ncbi:aminoimidazole riboside kinase [Fictibacillus iocasae]|uniref:Aminoimidazole riboside kinase n=1 Tax=Fictibacillus iocasae TaxID=2715437 RepID=A0ABW2NR11_9BACL
MKNGVISLGEALIDFIPLDEQNITYQKSPGGAPANVAVGLARLGLRSVFLGKVGDDVLGNFLIETLHTYGVNTAHIYKTKETRTGAVFVTLAANGERSFDFYIDPSADRFLEAGEIDESLFQQHKILHFGSISLISEPSKSATETAVQYAKKNGMLVSYDPNLRLSLWESPEKAKKAIIDMLPNADIVKISDEELTFLTEEEEFPAALKKMEAYEIPLLLVTFGENGSYCITKNGHVHVPAMKVDAVDTTGAGDAFVSGMLYQLNRYEGELADISLETAAEMARFASVSGGLAASVKGAMTALPTLQQVTELVLLEK